MAILSEIQREVAQRIASGNLDPTRLTPLSDICPSYQPKAHGKLNLQKAQKNTTDKAVLKQQTGSPAEGKGLLKFFSTLYSLLPCLAPAYSSSAHQTPPSPPRNRRQPILAGRDSGKRKLADEMATPESGLKRRKSEEGPTSSVRRSRYFASPRGPREIPEAEVILISSDTEKENLDLASDVVDVGDARSVLEWQQDPADEVVQEDGYHSASSWDAAILSSPVRKPREPDISDPDYISSPPGSARRGTNPRYVSEDIPTPNAHRRLPALTLDSSQDCTKTKLEPVNLMALFEDLPDVTPVVREEQLADERGKEEDPIVLSDLEEDDLEMERQERQRAVGEGWRQRWAYKPPVKASVTTTPRPRQHAHGIKFEGFRSLPGSAVRQ